jgi:hypothetical protein
MLRMDQQPDTEHLRRQPSYDRQGKEPPHAGAARPAASGAKGWSDRLHSPDTSIYWYI